MKLETLQELYVDELRDLYNAEQQLVKALPKMAQKASSTDLKRAFEDHLRQTEQHVTRLEQVFQNLGEKPTGKVCKGMQGLIEEGQEMIKEDAEPQVKDAGLISMAQRVEHYEMAGYGTVRTYAQQLGLDDQANLLQQTLDEEGNANELLTHIAESSVNAEAEEGSREEEETTGRRGDRQVQRNVATEGTRSRGRGGRGGARPSRSTQARAR